MWVQRVLDCQKEARLPASSDRETNPLLLRLLIVLSALLLAFFANNLFPSTAEGQWALLDPIPRGAEAGGDFRLGIYDPATVLRATGDPYSSQPHYIYPPLVATLGVPVSFLPFRVAYRVHVIGLFLAAVGSVVLISDATRRAVGGGADAAKTQVELVIAGVGGAVAFLLASSYGLTFALERGNYDALAMSLSVCAVWLMVRNPRHAVWGAILCISVATHLKVYPAVLFALVFWRYGWRYVIHAAVINVALLLVIGPANAIRFVQSLSGYPLSFSDHNHSAQSFGHLLATHVPIPSSLLVALLLGVPLVVWTLGAVALVRQGRTDSGLLWGYCLSVPLMGMLPAISHDYKLILLYPVFTVLLVYWTLMPGRSAWPLMVTLVFAAAVSRSPVYVSLGAWSDKYPLVLGVEILVLVAILGQTPRDGRASALPTRLTQFGSSPMRPQKGPGE